MSCVNGSAYFMLIYVSGNLLYPAFVFPECIWFFQVLHASLRVAIIDAINVKQNAA